MLAYIARRLLYLLPTIFGVALLVFLLFNVAGPDPVRLALGQHASAEAIADKQAEWGLDKSLPAQFGDFLVQIVTFDYGRSYESGEPLSAMFTKGATVSLSLTAPPFIFSLVLNCFLAMLIAYKRGTFLDRFATAGAVMAMSVSYLVYIIGFQYIFVDQLEWFTADNFERGWRSVYYLLLPWIIMLTVSVGPDIRMYRTFFLDEMNADYVRTARAKGVREPGVLFKHVLKNVSIPILTYTVVSIPFLILGAFLMERFFSLPGLGNLLITAIQNGDYPVLKGLTMYIAIGYSLFNLLTDVLYAWVDPRVNLS
ncbi:MAG: ABC transporter permease [Myxococcota bacterium]|nr:ABC transporter permease [Myxococcota bacterium]